jgi:hypothetical protein
MIDIEGERAMAKQKTTVKRVQRGKTGTVKTKTTYWSMLMIGGPLALLLIGMVIWMQPARKVDAVEITVYKSPTCDCCRKWVDHLDDAGFNVKTINRNNMESIKLSSGVKPKLRSCHTALVEGYVVEGHVPADDIKRMLQEQPAITGLAAPGMPMGSPGMEGKNSKPYNVLSFDNSGLTKVYARH